MKNTEESPTGRHDRGNVPLFCFSVGKRVAERKKKIVFPLHFEFLADAFTSSCSASM